MTKDELAERLNHLDPGATLTMESGLLAEAFGVTVLTKEAAEDIDAFALEHRCTFVYDPAGGHRPAFEKDDIF